MKLFYPEAKDANKNIGKKLDAYYDEDLKKWIFPGEEVCSHSFLVILDWLPTS